MKACFAKYQEPARFEGRARNEIMASLIHQQWVRIRKKKSRQNECWLFQYAKPETEAAIKQFLVWALQHNIIKPLETVQLHDIELEVSKNFEAREVLH